MRSVDVKKITISSIAILSFALFANAERISINLVNAKISTAVDAISQVSNINILWDKDAVAKRDKLVSVSISRPADSLQLLNIILNQNGLILVKDQKFNVYYVKEADEFSVVLPLEALSLTGVEPFLKLVEYIKSVKTENATFEYNQTTYSIYYKDTKENILKVKMFADSYVKYLVDVSQKQRETFEKKGKPVRREYKMSYEDYKDIEPSILDTISSYGRVFYDKAEGKLVILDFNENIQRITPLISKKLKSKIITKCFYVREIEPGEIYNNIKYSDLSEIGSIIFKAKSVDVATILTETARRPDRDNPIGIVQLKIDVKSESLTQAIEKEEKNVIKAEETKATGASIEGDYLVNKLPRICISDYPEVIDKIKYKYSDVLLDRPYQILIEARIVEISSDSIRDLGIQWGGQALTDNLVTMGTNSPSASFHIPNANWSSPSDTWAGQNAVNLNLNRRYAVDFPAVSSKSPGGFSIGFVFGSLSNFLDVRISALESIGKTKLLSSPRVLTTDGETAIIRQGYEIPYIYGATATNPGNVGFKNAVMKLKVTPYSFVDGNIVLNIELSKDEADFTKLVGGIPPIYTKSLISRVAVKDGQIVVLGGILEKKERQSTAGVPGLMNIPILGNLFRNNYKQTASTELLIFISPKIVYD